MNANELRRNNLISFKNEIVKVSSIFNDNDIEIENSINNYIVLNVKITKPIPLTDEIILKCGFIKDTNGTLWLDLTTHYIELVSSNDGYFYPIIAKLPEVSSEIEQRVSINRIKHVHELQNLYFALTGKELEIKL